MQGIIIGLLRGILGVQIIADIAATPNKGITLAGAGLFGVKALQTSGPPNLPNYSPVTINSSFRQARVPKSLHFCAFHPITLYKTSNNILGT